MAAAAAWSLIVFALGGWGLSELYRQSALRGLDRELDAVVEVLIATVEADGRTLRVPSPPADRRFSVAYRGRYWQVSVLGEDAPRALRSESLWDFGEVKMTKAQIDAVVASPTAPIHFNTAGPEVAKLRAAAQMISIDNVPVVVLVAGDQKDTERDVRRFTVTLLIALAVLGAGLIVGVFLQVRLGLAPLGAVQRDVADVRRGRKARLEGEYPKEVAPLTRELNALLDHNRDVVERARTHVGNLAHALKTPISVLLNEGRADKTALGEVVTRQAEGMARNVEHYLQRAQAAARAETLGARTPVRPVLEDIIRTLERLYGRQRDIEIELDALHDAVFRGERQDLEEMAGNLMENACKYGDGHIVVRLKASLDEGPLEIVIEDDGPGLSEAEQELALQRGARLDETAPGQGLGLSITADLARAYGGRLDLARSALGGLRAALSLPATD